jgi:hypothetical protein
MSYFMKVRSARHRQRLKILLGSTFFNIPGHVLMKPFCKENALSPTLT